MGWERGYVGHGCKYGLILQTQFEKMWWMWWTWCGQEFPCLLRLPCCFVMDGSELIKSVGFQWESAVVCKLIFGVSPLLNRGVANFPIGGSSVSPLGACYWWCSEWFLRGLSGNFSPCHGCCQSPRSYLIWSVLKKLKLCSFQDISSLSGMIPDKTHIFSGSKPTTQLLPPGHPAWPRCFSLLGSSGLHEPPPSQRLVLAMFWRDPPGFH